MTTIRPHVRQATAAERANELPPVAPLVTDDILTGVAEGWTRTNDNTFTFDVPPGEAFRALNFGGLVTGNQYRLTFTASGDTNIEFYFRPGAVGLDLVVDHSGFYDHTFTAADSNGVPRFAWNNISGVTQTVLTNVLFYNV